MLKLGLVRRLVLKKYFIVIFIFCCGILFAQSEFEFQEATVVSPKISGIGIPFSTYKAEGETLFTNPALLRYMDKPRWEFARISGSMTKDAITSVPGFFNKELRKNLINNIFSKDKYDYKLNISGPLSVVRTGNNFGIGLFNNTHISAIGTKAKADKFLMGEELLFMGAYATELHNDGKNFISLGVQAKTFFQAYSYALDADKTTLLNSASKKFKDLKIMFVGGFGFDFGLLYRYKNYVSLGLSCKDAYTAVFLRSYDNFEAFKTAKPTGKVEYKYIYPNLNFGISTTPVEKGVWTAVSSWSFYLEYRDIVNAIISAVKKTSNPLFNIAAGTEIVFHDILTLRAGMYGLYPHAGIEFDFTYFDINFAGYLESKSTEIWKDYYLNVDFALSFKY